MPGGVSNQQAIGEAVRPADVADCVCWAAAIEADILDRHWDRTVGNHAVGGDWRLAGFERRPRASSSENVAAQQAPEQDYVDDVHDNDG